MAFFRNRKQLKLYKQWVKHSGLPSDAIPQELINPDYAKNKEVEKVRRVEKSPRSGIRQKAKAEKRELIRLPHINALYLLLALVFLILILVLVLILINQ